MTDPKRTNDQQGTQTGTTRRNDQQATDDLPQHQVSTDDASAVKGGMTRSTDGKYAT